MDLSRCGFFVCWKLSETEQVFADLAQKAAQGTPIQRFHHNTGVVVWGVCCLASRGTSTVTGRLDYDGHITPQGRSAFSRVSRLRLSRVPRLEDTSTKYIALFDICHPKVEWSSQAGRYKCKVQCTLALSATFTFASPQIHDGSEKCSTPRTECRQWHEALINIWHFVIPTNCRHVACAVQFAHSKKFHTHTVVNAHITVLNCSILGRGQKFNFRKPNGWQQMSGSGDHLPPFFSF